MESVEFVFTVLGFILLSIATMHLLVTLNSVNKAARAIAEEAVVIRMTFAGEEIQPKRKGKRRQTAAQPPKTEDSRPMTLTDAKGGVMHVTRDENGNEIIVLPDGRKIEPMM
jgi:hypothetical protein